MCLTGKSLRLQLFLPYTGSLTNNRYHYMDRTGTIRLEKEKFVLPAGWEWTSDWQVDVNESTDQEGWRYRSTHGYGTYILLGLRCDLLLHSICSGGRTIRRFIGWITIDSGGGSGQGDRWKRNNGECTIKPQSHTYAFPSEFPITWLTVFLSVLPGCMSFAIAGTENSALSFW